VLVVIALVMAAQAPPPSRETEMDVPVTGETLTVTTLHEVDGVERYGQILVATSGRLVIPSGGKLLGTSLMMAGSSRLEMTGGIILIRGVTPGVSTQISGLCQHVDLTQGSTIRVWGINGTSSVEGSMGTSAFMSLRAETYINIANSTVDVMGGHGHSPEAPFSVGPLSGDQCSGGDADLSLVVADPQGALNIRSSTVRVLAGNGGDAPDGQPQDGAGEHGGGGYSQGGEVSGNVGRGGSATLDLGGDQVYMDDSTVDVLAGRGGDAGDGGQVPMGDTSGGGGGGYSGGDGSTGSGELPKAGGRVSDDVGSGGDATMDVAGNDYIQTESHIRVHGGDGGDAGHGGGSLGDGGGGGGGYSGGGGGSTSEPTGAPGGLVGGRVASGGDARASIIVDSDMRILGSNLSLQAGEGGDAGNGGPSSGNAGCGGGGFSGGGGAGSSYTPGFAGKPMLGGDGSPVMDLVSRGGDAALRLNSSTGYLEWNEVHARAGDGGGGGQAGRTWQNADTDVWLGGGGGGSYSAAGGGAFSPYSLDTRGGGVGAQVSGGVGDGGDSSLRLEIVTSTVHLINNISSTRGEGGLCWRSQAAGLTGGDGKGRFTRDGRAHTFIPMGRTHLLTPYDTYESGELPLHTWKPLHPSTANGAVLEWNFEVAYEPDFIIPIYHTTVSNNSLQLFTLEKGKLYWRVTPLYSRPERRMGIPSEPFIYTHVNSPPEVDEIPLVNVTVRVPRTVDLYPFVRDVDDPIDDLTISYDSPNILWRSRLLVTFMYDRYEPPHDVAFRVDDGLASTEGTIPIRVLDDNHDPVLLGLGDINPPIIIVMDEGDTRKYQVRYYDRDGDPVTIHLLSDWDGVAMLENNTVEIKADFGDVGLFEPIIVARDDRGGRSQMTLKIRVGNVGEPPEAPVFQTPRNGARYNEGDAVLFTVTVEDTDFIFGDSNELTVISNISGVLISTETNGSVTFTMADLGPGHHRITAIVEDGDVSLRTELNIVVVGDPEPSTVWEPPDELWLVIAMVAMSLILLVVSYMAGYRRRKARTSL
jgi:hypothetical protein